MNIKRKLRLIFSLVSLIICFGLSSVMVMADDVINLDETATQEETTLSAEDMKTYADGKITMAQAKALVEQYANAISQYSNCSDDELEYLGGYFSYQTDAFEKLLAMRNAVNISLMTKLKLKKQKTEK